MPLHCLHKNPLLHGGTSQAGRVLQALQPDYARLDDRTTADLVLFAEAYAQYLNYYNAANEKDGNWQAFMRMDLTVVLALLARMPVLPYLAALRRNLQFITNPEHNQTDALKRELQQVFDATSSWMYAIETYCRQLPESWPFRLRMQDTIASSLAYERYKLQRWYDLALTEGLVMPPQRTTDLPLRFDVYPISQLQAMHWLPYWNYTPDPELPFDPAVYGTTAVARIRSMALNNLFTGIIDTVFQQSAAICREAEQDINRSLEQYPRHTPHYALLLTFIRLFGHAQQELNTITGRHLNLYYQDILNMRLRPAQGDFAHVLVALQKHVAQHLLPAGTAWQGGKDAEGNPIWYTAVRDTVLNQASVAALQNLLVIGKNGRNQNFQQIYAAPVANSADGRGEALQGEDTSWATFGQGLSANLPSVGFAIASHLLFLQEGNRTITLHGSTSQDLRDMKQLFDSSNRPTVWLTGEKGWQAAAIEAWEQDPRNSRSFKLQVSLSSDQGPVVPYQDGLHQAHLQTSMPVCRILFKATAQENTLQLWSTIDLEQIRLTVNVNGLTKLTLHNGTSQIDASKPFNPFTATPYAGSALLVGSKEIFCKRNAEVKLAFEWDNIPQPEGIISHMSFYQNGLPYTGTIYAIRHETFYQYSNYLPQVTIQALEGGVWNGNAQKQNLFSSRELFGDDLVNHLDDCGDTQDLRERGLFEAYPEATFEESESPEIHFSISQPMAPDYSGESPYMLGMRKGFIRITLNRDLGHKDFVQRFTQQASKQLPPPADPYTPLAKSIKASYTADQTLDFTDRSRRHSWQFFSIHPFGSREERHTTNREAAYRLTPAFTEAGTLFIGLKDALPNTSISLLMQVNEGSANPMLRRQPLQWQYLAEGNRWRSYAEGEVTDDTNGLLQSGIVTLALPADIAEAPSLMGSKLHWVKVSVQHSPEAVCRMLSVQAQAIKLIWHNAGQPSTVFTQPTPAGTISKLVKPDSAIKKTEQPYDSFGGRQPELPAQYQQRVSERLRHKQRAITIWDYERLVLEAFPEIYKVKCLNHTRVRLNAAGVETGDNEMAPGSVVVVPIPDVSKLKSRNPLRPLTPLDTLSRITAYLQQKVSAQVQLQVCNPTFEEVVIGCRIKFHGNDPAFYHKQLLEDLKKFMCPWAYAPQQDVAFGGSINKSVLINFIEERPYVDYLSHMTLHLRINQTVLPQDLDTVAASTSRSVLVIAPENLHSITYTTPPC